MTVTTHTCVVVSCDTPDCDPWQNIGEGITPHFSTADEAVTVLGGEEYGFTFAPDGVYCRTCSCRRHGHNWSDWETRRYTLPGQSICHRLRYCLTCGRTDTRTGTGEPGR